jgi:sterol 3beta-glucosyltransferase
LIVHPAPILTAAAAILLMLDPGLLPAWESLRNGDITSKRKMTAQMLDGFWEATFSPDSVTGKPFAVDAIISNPPAFST